MNVGIMDAMDDLQKQAPDFDADEAARLCGLSGLQKEFALAKLKGANNTQAARAAGYSGDDEQLRSAGHRAFKSSKVQSFLALAEREGYGVPDQPGDVAELQRILWRHARGADKAAALRASEILSRLEREQKEQIDREREAKDPLVLLEELAGDDPVFAFHLSDKYGLLWPEGHRIHAIVAAAGFVPCQVCGTLYRPKVRQPDPQEVREKHNDANGAAA